MLMYVPCIFIALATCLYWYARRNVNYWKKRNVVGPEAKPLFGNMKEVAQRKVHPGDRWKQIYNEYRDQKVIGILRMTSPCLIMVDLDLIKTILIKDFDDFADRGLEFSTEGLGANLFHANEKIWRLLRNRLTPIFTSGKLKNMFHLLDERSDDFVNHLAIDKSKIVEYDVKAILNWYTISTISACAFGIDIDLNDVDRMKALARMDDELFTTSFMNELELLIPGTLRLISISLFPAHITKFFHDKVKTVFTQRNGKPSGRRDFMDLILELMQDGEIQSKNGYGQLKITESVTAAQAFAFYAAGYETSATAMTYLLYHLALDQDIQNKLIEEIDDVVQRHNGKITYDAISEMSYLSRVLDETLRMYPAVETLQRMAKKDYRFPGTNIVVEKGVVVLIPALAIHYDDRYYPNPEVFYPERFAPENVRDRHPCAYLPFGTGPRNCIGMRFGKLQSSLGIAKLLSKFRVEPSSRTPKKVVINPARVVYSPLGGLHLNFVLRK